MNCLISWILRILTFYTPGTQTLTLDTEIQDMDTDTDTDTDLKTDTKLSVYLTTLHEPHPRHTDLQTHRTLHSHLARHGDLPQQVLEVPGLCVCPGV